MSEQKPAVTTKNVADYVFDFLRESKLSQIRERKSEVQKEFMIARRWIQGAYAEFGPDDLPLDLQRLRRDLEVHRDQLIADATAEIEKSHDVAKNVIESVADDNPSLYRSPPKRKMSMLLGTPKHIAKHLTPSDMHRIVEAILEDETGVSLLGLCERLGLTSPAAHVATKRFLVWLRRGGHLSTRGLSGRGTRYEATPSLKRVLTKLTPAGK